MLCFPGLTPVAKDAHDVGDSGETVVSSFVSAPILISRENAGISPRFRKTSSSAGSIPSKPRTMSLGRSEVAGREHADQLMAIAATPIMKKDARRMRPVYREASMEVGTLLACDFSALTMVAAGSAWPCLTLAAYSRVPGRP